MFFISSIRTAGIYRVLRSGGRLVIYVTSRDTMQKWPFAGPDTHRTFDAHDLTNFLVNAGFRSSDITIANAELALGIKGYVAVAETFVGSIPRDKIAQRRTRAAHLARHSGCASSGQAVDH